MKLFFCIKIILIFAAFQSCSPKDPDQSGDGDSPSSQEQGPVLSNTKTADSISGLNNSPNTNNNNAGNNSTRSAAAPETPTEELKVIKYLDKVRNDSLIGFHELMPNGQIALWLNDNEQGWIPSMWRDFSPFVNTAWHAMWKFSSENGHILKSLVCSKATLEEKKNTFISSAIPVGTVILVDSVTASVETYLGQYIRSKKSDAQHYGVIGVDILDNLIVKVRLAHTRNHDAPVMFTERLVENLDLGDLEDFGSVSLTDYLTILEDIKGPNWEFPPCAPPEPPAAAPAGAETAS